MEEITDNPQEVICSAKVIILSCFTIHAIGGL